MSYNELLGVGTMAILSYIPTVIIVVLLVMIFRKVSRIEQQLKK